VVEGLQRGIDALANRIEEVVAAADRAAADRAAADREAARPEAAGEAEAAEQAMVEQKAVEQPGAARTGGPVGQSDPRPEPESTPPSRTPAPVPEAQSVPPIGGTTSADDLSRRRLTVPGASDRDPRKTDPPAGSQTDADGWVGLAVVAVVTVICWLAFASMLRLNDRQGPASRSVRGPAAAHSLADRCFPIGVGVLAAAVAGAVVLADAQLALSSGWRWVAYLGVWTLLGTCATGLAVETMDRASGRWAFGGGIVAVVLSVAGSVLGFVSLA
jgi:hypothetical protein